MENVDTTMVMKMNTADSIRKTTRRKEQGDLPPGNYGGITINPKATTPNPLVKMHKKAGVPDSRNPILMKTENVLTGKRNLHRIVKGPVGPLERSEEGECMTKTKIPYSKCNTSLKDHLGPDPRAFCEFEGCTNCDNYALCATISYMQMHIDILTKKVSKLNIENPVGAPPGTEWGE